MVPLIHTSTQAIAMAVAGIRIAGFASSPTMFQERCHAFYITTTNPSLVIRMGGGALGTKLPRLSRVKYSVIVKELKELLIPNFYGYVQEPRSLPSKDSFGDVDLLVADIRMPIQPMLDLGSSKFFENGTVLSFEFSGHQVDLIGIPLDRLDLSHFCFDYGELGIIVGIICRVIGLKFGFQGLSIIIESQKIELSHDLGEILDFLGLSLERWKEGFDYEDEVFEYIATCKYFRRSMFVFKNRAPLALKKREERVMFTHWVEYVSKLPPNGYKGRVDSDKVKLDAISMFGKEAEVLKIEEGIVRRKVIRDKFNGILVREWTDKSLNGAALRSFMRQFKQEYPELVLKDMSLEQIRSAVRQSHLQAKTRLLTFLDQHFMA